MRIFADLQLHSKYAIATSRDTDLEHLARGARRKGLNLLGTGDFTHPKWFAELKSKLIPLGETGLFHYADMTWMLSGEVSTVYEQGGKKRKVHHLLYAPGFEIVAQVNEALSKYGSLGSDGRPVLTGIDSPRLVELLHEVSHHIVVIPAHVWTPWFGALGSKSGFDSLADCYGDQVRRIFALETGLSSDPAMNWRLSQLDGFALVSNSDAHSPNPWRLGREANVFELRTLSYGEVFEAIRSKDASRFLFTVEVDPSYGKYHLTGHKKCGVSLTPAKAKESGNICPKCGKKLTVGVLQRVDQLADRPDGYIPNGSIPFKRLLPLYEVISFATGVGKPYVKRVIQLQDKLIDVFGSEFSVLLDVPREDLERACPSNVARAIIATREGRLNFIPGYDGVYGIPEFPA